MDAKMLINEKMGVIIDKDVSQNPQAVLPIYSPLETTIRSPCIIKNKILMDTTAPRAKTSCWKRIN